MTAAEYFGAPEFSRLLELCRSKYMSLSHIGGNIILNDVTDAERDAIGGLMGRVYDGKDIKLKLNDLDSALKRSRFAIGLDELLNKHFGKIVTKNERAEEAKAERERFFAELMSCAVGEKSAKWLKYMIENKTVLIRRYNDDRDRLKRDTAIVCRAIERLGDKPYLLPVFSAEVSGDPHMLDDTSSCGQLFTSAAEYLTGETDVSRRDMLEAVGIYSDMVSSFVYCRGISLYDSQGEHKAFGAFNAENEAFTLNIGNLNGIVRASAIDDRVFIVENPAVFTMLCMGTDNVSVICPSGQPKSACIKLLDLLGDTAMYYSGDFDIGGIRIIQRLLKRYPNMRLWRSTPEDYTAALSDKKLSAASIKELGTVTDSRLKDTLYLMIKTGYAGYQENISGLLRHDLKKMCNKKENRKK